MTTADPIANIAAPASRPDIMVRACFLGQSINHGAVVPFGLMVLSSVDQQRRRLAADVMAKNTDCDGNAVVAV